MKQIYAAALLVLAIVLASCAPEPPPYFTWCYSYDFYNSVDGINIISGDWVDGTGIVTDEDGLIQVNWVEDVDYVDLNHLTVRVKRASPGSSPFQVSANGIIFGIAASFTQSYPPSLYPVDFDGVIPIFATPDPQGSATNNANITIQADEPFVLHSVEVKGEGPNPFGVNTCGDLTPTPEITLAPTVEPATPAVTATPSPTVTATEEVITITPSTTNTIQPTATCVAGTPYSAWWGAPNPYHDPSLLPGSFVVTSGTFSPTDGGGFWRGIRAYSNGTEAVAEITWTLPIPTRLDNFGFQIFAGYGGGYNHPASRYYIYLDGDLVIQGTPARLGFDNYAMSGSIPTPRYVSEFKLRVTEPHHTSGALAYIGRMYLASSCLGTATPTPQATATATPTSTITSTASRTPTPSLTPLPSLTPGTPRPSATPARTLAPVIGPTYTYVLGTLPPLGESGSTPFMTSTPSASVTPITVTPGGTPPEDGDSDGVFMPWGSYSGPDQTQSDIGEIGGALTNVTSNLFSLGSRYLGEFTGMIDQIVVGWRTSTPTVIPGMPRCQSDRLRSELCAIYYIIQYTILGDPLGTIVLQVAIIVIDLFIGVTFILLARSILEQLRRILHI